MPHPRYSREEVVRRGKVWYEQQLRAKVESNNTGKFLVIDIEIGEYEIDGDEVAALKRARAKRSDASLYSFPK